MTNTSNTIQGYLQNLTLNGKQTITKKVQFNEIKEIQYFNSQLDKLEENEVNMQETLSNLRKPIITQNDIPKDLDELMAQFIPNAHSSTAQQNNEPIYAKVNKALKGVIKDKVKEKEFNSSSPLLYGEYQKEDYVDISKIGLSIAEVSSNLHKPITQDYIPKNLEELMMQFEDPDVEVMANSNNSSIYEALS